MDVLIIKEDGYINGAYNCDGLTFEKAEAVFRECLTKAQEENPEDWTYDDINRFMALRGLSSVNACVINE